MIITCKCGRKFEYTSSVERPGKMIFRTLIVAKGDTRVYVENSVQEVMDIILNCRRHGDGK